MLQKSNSKDTDGPALEVVQARVDKGLEMAAQGRVQEALRWFSSCVEDEPNIPLFLIERAKLYQVCVCCTPSEREHVHECALMI